MTKRKTRESEERTTGCTGTSFGPMLQDVDKVPSGAGRRTVETIEYDTGGAFNECTARKESIRLGIPLSDCSYTQRHFQVKPGSPEYTDVWGKFHSKVEPVVEPLDSTLTWLNSDGYTTITAEASDLQQARYDAYMRLTHMVDVSTMNISQSLYELKDTKQTLKPAIEFTKWGRQACKKGLVVTGKGLFRRWKKKLGFASSLGDIAAAYLWYTFGVSPTVSDVKTFLKQLSEGKLSVQGKKNMRIPKGTVMVSRYSALPNTAAIGEAMFARSVGKDGGVSIEETETYKLPPYSTAYHFPMRASHIPFGKVVYVKGERGCYFAKLSHDLTLTGSDVLSNRFNWSCPPLGTYWEITPFSFLVDWFVDVGQAIRNLERKFAGLDYSRSFGPIWHSSQNVTDVYYPRLVAYKADVVRREAPEDWSTGGDMTVTVSGSAAPSRGPRSFGYRRKPAEQPHIPGLHTNFRLKAYQISSGMALLMQFANGLSR